MSGGCECRIWLASLDDLWLSGHDHVVLCVCGRHVHRDCASLIDGAWYGPDCAKRLREGEAVPQMVPGEETWSKI